MDEQEAYMQMQMLQQQMQQIQQHMEQMDERLEEAKQLKKSMEDFENLEEGDEVLVPVASGIFARAELTDLSSLKVNVGSGVVVGKTVKEAQDMIDTQVVEIKKIREKIQDNYDETVKQAEALAAEIRG